MKNLSLLLAGLLSLAGLTACNHQPLPAKNTVVGQTSWQDYQARSTQWQKLDRDFMTAELNTLAQKKPQLPTYTKEFGFDPEQAIDWFNTAEGQRIADILVSFQTPSGGWSKRTDMSKHVRRAGEAFGVEEHYIPTFDNGATSTQMELLAKAYTATGKQTYVDAFHKGLNLILEAQYPNGGWPQNYPLVGGYHDHITYNDALMKDLMSLLHRISLGRDEFAFVSLPARDKAAISLQRGIDCVVKTQVKVNGKLTLWGAQHDAQTLQPAKARAYEMAALATAESVSMLAFLMDIKQPSPDVIRAIHSAIAWYEENKILGYTWKRGDKAMTADPDAPPMWSRFVEIGTNRPIFGDRDGSIHYRIEEVSQERREGYAWFTSEPSKVFKKYASWAIKHPDI